MAHPLRCFLLLLPAFLWLAARARAESFVLFESGHVRPLALSPARSLLLAVNTPDNRLEVFETAQGTLRRRGEVVVGLEPVAVVARTETQAFVVNHLSDSVSVVNLSEPDRPIVVETLLVGDEPRDVVCAGPGRRWVFVTAARRGRNRPGDPQLTTPGVGRADLWVFDAEDFEPSITSRTLCLRGSTWIRRGDANADGRGDLADAVFGLNFLFRGGPAPHCERSLDADDDGAINLGDSLHLLQYLLFRGPPPASPFPACGSEGSEALPCSLHPPCV
jgi:hypothetical protein